ncbi:putative glycolipid-binding domain-containing protein [Actinoplanes sp. NPDC049681]|uniref:putative glycolipid-binding domain-containing protein n=1 Tax=Actinoplanes sp. NPDC049681 TaxID=3363905 RepID=UPI0037A8383C
MTAGPAELLAPRKAPAPPAPPAPAAHLAWQRTDTVGTELVFPSRASAEGTAVIAGPVAYASQWHADFDGTGAVRRLTVTCRGAQWARTLDLSREDDEWSCRTEETGDLAAHGRGGQPPPGIDDPLRLADAAVVRLGDSPASLGWALRRLGLTPASGPVTVPTVRVLVPSLAVLPGVSTYQMLGPHRLRVTGDDPACTYEVDDAGVVTYQPGRYRLVH